MAEAKDRGFSPTTDNFGRRCIYWEFPLGCCHSEAKGIRITLCGGIIDYCVRLIPLVPLVNIALSIEQLPQRKS